MVDEAAKGGDAPAQASAAGSCRRSGHRRAVGDAQQLQAIDAGAAFRVLAERLGRHTLDEVRRQQTSWQRAATRELAQGRTWAALQRYRRADCLQGHGTAAQAQAGLLAAWLKDVRLHPEGSRLLLAHRRRDVLSLNLGARALLVADGKLRGGRAVTVQAGDRWMAAGERIAFLRNDARLGVRNGTSGVVVAVSSQALEVLVDGTAGGSSAPRRFKVPLVVYPHIDYGYAATVHRAQGMTVDRTFAYASPGWDRHATYVALTRHRVAVHLAWSKEDFRQGLGALMQRLSRSGRKDMAFDHLLAARP